MGFTDLSSDADLALLNNWFKTRSYIEGYYPSQADVTVFQQLKQAPAPEKYPFAWRWYSHLLTLESAFKTLPGDSTVEFTAYGPDASERTASPAKASETVTAHEDDKNVSAGTSKAAEHNDADDDDDVDLFGSDDEEEDAEAEKLKAERLAEYNKKKAGKVKPAAKSMVTLDVKPWDDETNMDELKAHVLSIEKDGLVWGGSSLKAVGFGIKKLQINLVIEDEKVSLDDLQQEIEAFEDHVQSTDVVAMQKI